MKLALLVCPLCVVLLLLGCPAPTVTPGPDDPADAGGDVVEDAGSGFDATELVRTLVIEPAAQQAFVDELASFRVFLDGDDGSREDVTGVADWLMDGDLVGIFKAPGVVLVQAAGTASVIARLHGEEVAATLTGLAAEANVMQLRLEPAALEVPVGLSVPLRAIAVYDDGQARDVTALATWESLDPTLCAVEEEAGGVMVRGLAEGSGQVRAAFAGRLADATVEVVAAVLVAIEIYPGAPHLPAGANLQVHAIGRFADGELFDLTDAVTWSSSDQAVFVVSSSTGTPGRLAGVAAGAATLTARAEADAIEASVEVTVTPAAIVGLEIAPALIRLPAGSAVGLRATAVLTTEVVIDVTREAIWSIDDGEAAYLTGGAGAPLRLQAVYPTTSAVRASYGGETAVAQLVITQVELELIEVYPLQWSLPAGEEQQFWVVGTYGDASLVDHTPDATWTTSAPGVALVADAPRGRVIAVAPGLAEITAAYQGLSSSAEVRVTDAEVVSLQIHPPLATIPAGEEAEFVAIGIYSDQTQRGLTHQTTWSVDDEEVAVISNALGAWGRALGQSPGTVTVTAQYGDLTDTSTLHITDAVVDSILVTPPYLVLTPGRGEQCQAWASYSNGTTLQVGDQAVWSSSDGAVVEASNATGQRGWLTALAPGQASVTARFGGVAGATVVYVLDQAISGVMLWPQDVYLAPGLSEQIYLVGWYDDIPDEYVYLNWEAIWSSSDEAIATVGNYPSTPGLISAQAPGRVTISARWNDQEIMHTYQVRDLRVTGLLLSPPDPTLPIDAIQTFVALATMEDGTTLDVTATTSFSSDDNTVVNMFEYAPGAAWALAPGTATITASFTGQQATVTVTVIDAVPQQIVLSPVNPIIELYASLQMYATAIYSDGSTGDITALCSWASSDPGVLLVLDEPFGKGYSWGMATGSVTVRADCVGLSDSTVATVR